MANIFESKRVLDTISLRKQNIFCEWKRSLLIIHVHYASREFCLKLLLTVKACLFALLVTILETHTVGLYVFHGSQTK